MSSNSSYLSDYDYDDPVSNVVGEIIIYFVLIYFALIILTVVIAACKCCLQDYYFAYTLRRRQAATAAAATTTDSAGSIQVVIHRDISSLPTTHTYADPASICAICIREYKDGDVERVLPQCGHAFHRSCIDPWLMDHATCPICRASTVAAAQPPP